MRLRVILGDPLEEWRGTVGDWSAVPDRILFVQVEREANTWLTVHNADWYWLRSEAGRLVVQTATNGRRHTLGPRGEWDYEVVVPPLPPEAKGSVLVDADEWERAREMVRWPPEW